VPKAGIFDFASAWAWSFPKRRPERGWLIVAMLNLAPFSCVDAMEITFANIRAAAILSILGPGRRMRHLTDAELFDLLDI